MIMVYYELPMLLDTVHIPMKKLKNSLTIVEYFMYIDFIIRLDLNEDTYIMALRST
jgi:hypothetical protein